MANSGYILVDCGGLDLTLGSTPQTITGIRAKVEAAMKTKKQVLASNCKWGALDIPCPIAVFPIEIGDSIICTASTLQVYVEKDDSITIMDMLD